jgi:hypothetical protein
MAINFHLREPFLPDIITLISFIFFLIASILLKKEKKLKVVNLLIVGSLIAIMWYIIDFFVPGIILPTSPTLEDLEFTRLFGIIFNGLIPDSVLILSLGIFPLLFFIKNKTTNSILFLGFSGIIQTISVIIGINPGTGLLSLISLTTTAISMGLLAYYSYNIKQLILIVFCVSFFISRLLLLLMI